MLGGYIFALISSVVLSDCANFAEEGVSRLNELNSVPALIWFVVVTRSLRANDCGRLLATNGYLYDLALIELLADVCVDRGTKHRQVSNGKFERANASEAALFCNPNFDIRIGKVPASYTSFHVVYIGAPGPLLRTTVRMAYSLFGRTLGLAGTKPRFLHFSHRVSREFVDEADGFRHFETGEL